MWGENRRRPNNRAAPAFDSSGEQVSPEFFLGTSGPRGTLLHSRAGAGWGATTNGSPSIGPTPVARATSNEALIPHHLFKFFPENLNKESDMNLRLALALILTLLLLSFAKASTAQTPPLIVVIPDTVTGIVDFQAHTNTDDVRVTDTCVYRIDANSPDVDTPVACVLVASGTAPGPDEQSPSGEGVIVNIRVTIPILPVDQIFGLRNVGAIDGQTIQSVLSANSGILPFAIVAPLFIVQGLN